MAYLLDTGFLYALLNRKEQQHEIVVAAARTVREPIILPVPAVTETFAHVPPSTLRGLELLP